jgi:hypothetical protein
MAEKNDLLIELLEKIAMELEIANKLKTYEIVISQPQLKLKFFEKFIEKAFDLDEEIRKKIDT